VYAVLKHFSRRFCSMFAEEKENYWAAKEGGT